MGSYVFFQMNSWTRQSLIDNHRFYVEQGRRRVMDQFSDLERLAAAAGEDWLDKQAHRFNPDDDPSRWMEAAHEHAIKHGEMLSDLKDHMRLAIVAGMFHNWEKEVRDWLAAEMQHWYKGERAYRAIWNAKLSDIIELLDCLGWKLGGSGIAITLDRCRLVVNVYKHGAGPAADDLRARYPDMLANGASWNDDCFKPRSESLPASRLYDVRLNVSDADLDAFSSAIVEFWETAPENVTGDMIERIPAWLEKAFARDEREVAPEAQK